MHEIGFAKKCNQDHIDRASEVELSDKGDNNKKLCCMGLYNWERIIQVKDKIAAVLLFGQARVNNEVDDHLAQECFKKALETHQRITQGV